MPRRLATLAIVHVVATLAGGVSSAAGQVVSPEEWSVTLLDRCLERRHRDERALAELRRRSESSPQAAEDLVFPDAEQRARTKQLEGERKRYFARLSYFLLGDRAQSLRPDEARRTGGPDPLQETLQVLFGDTTPCEMEAFQATLLFTYFNVPFSRARLEATMADEGVVRDVEHAFHRHRDGDDAETGYAAFDRDQSRRAQAYTRDFIRRLRQVASMDVADMREQRTKAGPAAQEALNDELQSALRRPDAPTAVTRTVEEDRELAALLDRMNTYLTRAAEPVRIRAYVHAKIDQFEGALRTSVPDTHVDRLQSTVDRLLFPNEASLVILQDAPIARIIARVNEVFDVWVRRDALPAVEKRLFEDPFSAYWFFVQTGGLPRAGRPYIGSRLTFTTSVGFWLDRLRAEAPDAVVGELLRLRVPGEFSERHAALEQALRDVVLTRQEALDAVAAAPLSERDRRRLETFVRDPGESDMLTTVDVYRWLIADSNRIAGSVDRGLVGAALAIMRAAKERRMHAFLDGIAPGANPQLAGYLRTAGAMMLELEERQGVDKRFHQGTEGGPVGWLFGGFLLGNSIPIQLSVPGGVTGPEFAELMNEIAPKNPKSGNDYHAKDATRIALVHDGEEYRDTAERIVDHAQHFLNVAGFDWKRDAGGRRLTYLIMAKKLGISGAAFDAFVSRFSRGLPVDRNDEPTRFYDLPPAMMKNLIFHQFFQTSTVPDVALVRTTLRALDRELACSSVRSCGDLSPLLEIAGRTYDARRATEPTYAAAWQVFRTLQRLFDGREPGWNNTKPRASLADYLGDGRDVRRFVERYGLQRRDVPGTPLPVNIIVDGKQSLLFNSTWGFAKDPPFVRDTPINDLYAPLMEFGAHIVLWKGVMEFPWRLGPIPVPGRKVFGVIPMPFIPYPWLSAVPGFGWAGTGWSLLLQFAAATDPRNWWAMVTHVKHFSNEREALESGLGVGSKYNNAREDFKTWHDMGVVVEGPIVDDANDYFVRIFNEARVNNSGNAAAKGIRIRKLEYADYRGYVHADGGAKGGNPSWFITTHPEHGDFNYRAALLSALAAARHNIFLESSFFSDPIVPRMLIRKAREFRSRVNCGDADALACSEKKRDAVQIHLVLPGASDKPALDTVATTEFHELLHLGVKIYRWDPPEGWSATKMLHTKAWLVDYEPGRGGVTYVGSANATQRSHILDEEAGIVSTSPAFADEVYSRLFEPDMRRDSRIENPENFHVTRSTNAAIRSGHWLRRLMLSLFFI